MRVEDAKVGMRVITLDYPPEHCTEVPIGSVGEVYDIRVSANEIYVDFGPLRRWYLYPEQLRQETPPAILIPAWSPVKRVLQL